MLHDILHNSTSRGLFRIGAPASVFSILTACGLLTERDALEESVVLLQPIEEVRGSLNNPLVPCKVSMRYVYPPDVQEHAREVDYHVVTSPRLSQGGPMPLPRPENDPRASLRDDGLMAFEFGLAEFGRCRTRGQAPVVEFTIGECVKGECPPMRYEAPDDAQIVEFRLVQD